MSQDTRKSHSRHHQVYFLALQLLGKGTVGGSLCEVEWKEQANTIHADQQQLAHRVEELTGRVTELAQDGWLGNLQRIPLCQCGRDLPVCHSLSGHRET
eukprot:785533-Amphidinium_carterae.2